MAKKILVPIKSQTLEYKILSNEENVVQDFKSLWSPNVSFYSIESYGDGTHSQKQKIDYKVKTWSERAKINDINKCFMFYSGGEVKGYINIGVGPFNGHEVGTFNKDNVSKDILIEAFQTVLCAYPFINNDTVYGTLSSIKHVKEVLGPQIAERKTAEIYNIDEAVKKHTDKIEALEAAGLKAIDKEIINAHPTERFKIEDDKIFENGREVEFFYFDPSKSVVCTGLESTVFVELE